LDHSDKIQPDHGLNHNPPGELSEDGEVLVPDSAETLGNVIRNHGPTVIVLGAIAALVAWWFGLAGTLNIIKVAVGLGFIIFIHELGHFLVAKWCDVHVTTFSIGFGPALPFCSWTWGETTCKLAMFPLGGYVQMVGQVDGDESSDGSEDDPRSYKNKSVWQRMAIISAGVIMNAIFACVAFTVVFLGPGKPRQTATIREVDSGKPAFVKGLRTRADIVRVDGIDKPYFEDVKYATISSLEHISFTTQRRYALSPQGGDTDPQPVTVDITPHQGSFRLIGFAPIVSTRLAPKKLIMDLSSPVALGSAAAQASPPFEFDDILVATTDPADPSKVTPLPNDPRRDNSEYKDYFELQRRLTLLAGKEIKIVVERGSGADKRTVTIVVPPAFHRTLGVRMKMGQITAIREGTAAADPAKGVVARSADGTSEGDIIEAVEVTAADGKTVRWEKGKNLDPVRLPYQLKQWAAGLWQARNDNPPVAERQVKLTLKRQNKNVGGPVSTSVTVSLEWDHSWVNDMIVPQAPTSPEPIAELGIAYLVKNEVDGPEDPAPGQPDSEILLQKDDEIVDVGFIFAKPDGSVGDRWETKWIKGTEWSFLFRSMQSPNVEKIKFKVKRAGKELEIAVTPIIDRTWPLDDRGLYFAPDTRIERAGNVMEAIEMGFRDTRRSMVQIYLQLRGFIAGTISVENLGGPVAITTTAYRVAQYDFWEFVFFLGLISVNLAVLNFLPIPVLDGGHMVFLIYEKLRGKPASEGVRIGATYAGLLLIGCLMIFVLVLDIRRLVGG
jgi:regulator of sigma E protease